MQNRGISILLEDASATDLKEILQVLNKTGKNSDWKISNVECFGKKAEILHQISDNETIVSGKLLYEIAEYIDQTIEGEFQAYKPDENTIWCLIRAVDGSVFDVGTRDTELLKRFHETFENIEELKY